MAIVSSSYVSDTHAQTGGGVWTTETHTDSDGVTYVIGPVGRYYGQGHATYSESNQTG
jgi:hypothetical protein